MSDNMLTDLLNWNFCGLLDVGVRCFNTFCLHVRAWLYIVRALKTNEGLYIHPPKCPSLLEPLPSLSCAKQSLTYFKFVCYSSSYDTNHSAPNACLQSWYTPLF